MQIWVTVIHKDWSICLVIQTYFVSSIWNKWSSFLSMGFIWELENKILYIKLTRRVQNVSENSKSYDNFDISQI